LVHHNENPTPAPILDLFTGYYAVRLLLAALDLDLFSLIDRQPMAEDEIREQTGLHPRGSGEFLAALDEFGMVTTDADGRYHNTPITTRYLLPSSSSFLGLMLCRRPQPWEHLLDTLLTGQPWRRATAGQSPAVPRRRAGADQDAVRGFLSAMDGWTSGTGRELAALVDWSDYKSFVDVQGGRGTVAAQLVDAHPWLTGYCLDLPAIEPYFVEHTLGTNVRFHPGDPGRDPLPTVDVVVFSHVLHSRGAAERERMLDEAGRAVRPGGAVVVHDIFADGTDRTRLPSMLESLHMQLVGEGGEYPVEECRSALRERGFTPRTAVPMFEYDTLVVADKPFG
jgi:SAM-dependent methyltransferase